MSQDPQENLPYPLRLPNYRSLHQGRYHPYPTFNRQQGALTQEIEDVEIADAPTIQTDEAGPSTQPGPAVTSQSQPAVNEQADEDLANLAVVVDHLDSTTSGSDTPRDSVDLVIAFASAMRRQVVASRASNQS